MTSSFYIALCGLYYVLLSAYVIKGRAVHKILIGDGDNQDLIRRMRCQGNFAEYTPLFLILLLASETAGLSALFIHVFGIAYLIARGAHAYSLLKAEKIVRGKVINTTFRVFGIMTTFTCITCLSGYLLFTYLF
jgi:uncharacterized membrane protein YecN with MAPEG domain